MFSLEDIKDWIIKHKKLVIAVIVIIALLIILYQYRYSNYYLNVFYSYVWPSSEFEYVPIVPSETSTGGYESLPQLYL